MALQIIGFILVFIFGLYMIFVGVFGGIAANAFGDKSSYVPMIGIITIGVCVIWWDCQNVPFSIVF